MIMQFTEVLANYSQTVIIQGFLEVPTPAAHHLGSVTTAFTRRWSYLVVDPD
jgi:hypothetical protein